MPEDGHQRIRRSRRSRLTVAAEIAAIVAVPVAVILAIAVQSNDDASDSKGTRPKRIDRAAVTPAEALSNPHRDPGISLGTRSRPPVPRDESASGR